MASTPLITAKDISVKRGPKFILQNISLHIEAGKIVTLIGPNGAGKTTLLKCILNIIHPTSGTLWRHPNLKIGYMPQKLGINPSLPLTVEGFLSLTQNLEKSHPSLNSTLAEVGVQKLRNQQLSTLSGGEWQRVMLSRALLMNPDLLVLDEPAQGIDIVGQAELYTLIGALRTRRGCGVILVSHDLHLVMASSDEVICLNRHICCSGSPTAVWADPHYKALFQANIPNGQEDLVEKSIAFYTHQHDHRHN